ncbi:hypothetical protein ER308_19310 [Egibacter rhizosphaerae]|uniref:Uncharacterized protein n=1 Tax=Egibacter rhizosphaerae TaxID=1670831 RepID=A0A411YJY0_9ACTN|nr:hypothetical protein [Egibacter rhizosphaerae]QBI21506.1 hypothetical protein ER308_19310 [Egibacter rhizosphaerae]
MAHAEIYSERGSLPLALLATIVIAGLAVVVTATMVTGQRQARFDVDYEQALHVAEIGLERGVHRVQTEGPVAIPPIQGSVESGSYEVEIDDTEKGDGRLTVRSTGLAGDGVERTVSRELRTEPFFDFAFFGEDIFSSHGEGEISLEDGETGLLEALDGLAGSNGEIDIGGWPSQELGRLVIADYDGDADRCSIDGDDCENGEYVEVRTDRVQAVTEGRLNEVATIEHGAEELEDLEGLDESPVPSLDGGDYKVEGRDLHLDDGFHVTGTGDAVRIVVRDWEEIHLGSGPGSQVNFHGSSSDLQIYAMPPHDEVPDSPHGEVELPNQSTARALLYAPGAQCGDWNGQPTFYGSMMCFEIDLGGGASLIATEDITEPTLDGWQRDVWREE